MRAPLQPATPAVPAIPPGVEVYDEDLVFRVYNPGTKSEFRGLVPSELDVALLNSQVSQQHDEVMRLSEAEPPPDMVLLQEQYPTLEGDEKTLAHDKLVAWEENRFRELLAWQGALTRTQKRLQDAVRYIDGFAAAEEGEAPTRPEPPFRTETRTFRLRDFTYMERLLSEDKHSTLDARGQRQVDVARRNLALLEKCLLCEVTGGNETPVVPAGLPAKLATVLIERLWARVEMSVELAGFMRPGRMD